jgi:hypothetical protein
MNDLVKHIIYLCIILSCTPAHGQQGFFVPTQGNVFFSGDSASIFSNVLNKGKLGLGKKAFVHFKGHQWENDPVSAITDENNQTTGSTGVISFSDTLPQLIIGGYNSVTRSGATFGNLQISNGSGVLLNSGTTKIRNELSLQKGLLYLNGNILVVGDGSPGLISGFDSAHFIVSNNSPGSGLLIREYIRARDGMVVFPMGSRQFAYTPAAVMVSSGAGDDYYATVFESVYSGATSGSNMLRQSVNKTWEIGKRSTTVSSAQIVLQHLNEDEGTLFVANRKKAYVTSFVNSHWDKGDPQSAPVAGFLTSGNSISSSGANGRWFKMQGGNSGYYTKLYSDSIIEKTKVWLSGYRKDEKTIEVYWFTKPEVNNSYFIVQRRLSNENDFISIDTIYTKASDGNSQDYLRYSINDPNKYRGLSYYRLIVVNKDGSQTYTDIIVVGAKAGGNELLMWPNPSTGRFRVGITGYASIQYVVVWNVIGQKLLQEPVNDRAIIEMQLNRPPGTYLVGFITFSGQVVDTKKLIIIPY